MQSINDFIGVYRKLEGSRVVAFRVIYSEITGSLVAGVLLSQFLWWGDNHADKDGWFQKTIQEITKYTSISRHEQDSAKKKLLSLGLIEKISKGIPAKTYFRVNHQKVLEVLYKHTQASMPNFGNLEESSSCGDNFQQDIDNSSMPNFGNLGTRSSERPMPNFGILYKQEVQDSLSLTPEENFRPVDNFTPTPQGQVCVEWVKLGIRCNPSNPTLLEALKAGVTPEELIETAKEIVVNVQNPSMNYIIKAVIGRRNDAAKLAQSLKDNPLPNKVLDFKRAYEEAVKQSRIRYEGGNDVWSSPAIYHAAKRLGGDLQKFPWQEIKSRWAEALDWAITGLKEGRLGESIPPYEKTRQTQPTPQEMASKAEANTPKSEKARKVPDFFTKEFEKMNGGKRKK